MPSVLFAFCTTLPDFPAKLVQTTERYTNSGGRGKLELAWSGRDMLQRREIYITRISLFFPERTSLNAMCRNVFNRARAALFRKTFTINSNYGNMRLDVFFTRRLFSRSAETERYSRDSQRFSLDFGQCTKIGSISVMIILGRSIKASWLLQDFRRV